MTPTLKGFAPNTLKHVKSSNSGIFKLAKQEGYYDGLNPVQDTATNPNAAEPEEGYAYTLEGIHSIMTALPEPAATALAVPAFSGLRVGEVEGMNREDFHDGAIWVSRSIRQGKENAPKTKSQLRLFPSFVSSLNAWRCIARARQTSRGSGCV